MSDLPVRAYTDKFSYEAGEEVAVHVSATSDATIRLIRMQTSSEDDPDLDVAIDWDAAGPVGCESQDTAYGSFMVGAAADDGSGSGPDATLGAFVWSADPACGETQTVIAIAGSVPLALLLRDGHPALSIGSGDEAELVIAEHALVPHAWHFVAATIADGVTTVVVEPVDEVRGRRDAASGTTSTRQLDLRGDCTVAARSSHRVEEIQHGARGFAEDFFTGKVESPFIAAGVMSPEDAGRVARAEVSLSDLGGLRPVARWDLAFHEGDRPERVRATAPGQTDGLLVNGPARGVTGRLFTGQKLDHLERPDEYAAIHFHATDLNDAGWAVAMRAALPSALDSGVYGVVVENETGSDTVPIVIVPRREDARRKVLVVLPTFTYLAYANEALFNGLDPSAMTDQEIVLEDGDQAHVGDPSFGLSMYDTHPDGTGVMFSSGQRQIVNMRRGYRMWLVGAGRAFSSDMYLIEWLCRRGIEVDVITDFEVHERGPEYLEPYSVIVSGSHPEYTSEEMLDTLTAYRDGGGGLMYLGGNGWYWVTGVYSEDPLIVEIRRGFAGVRCWESYPGEVNLFSTHAPGGLWRHRGRAPQVLSGVGFAAQGWGRSEPYHRSEAASDPDLAWVFEGIDEEPIGAYGEVMGGAAGDEIDRVDQSLGTPHHAAVLASSRDHSNFYQRVVEEIAMNLPDHGGGQQDPEVHSDIVYFRTPRGGEVFSAGSIAWSGALLHNGTDNGVSRMTENVIRRFVANRAVAE